MINTERKVNCKYVQTQSFNTVLCIKAVYSMPMLTGLNDLIVDANTL